MSENGNDDRKLRTWSALGDVRKRPTEYEIVTHATNYTMREGRLAPLEQNSSSPANLWMASYREGSPLQADDWEAFRDPDLLTYRTYVALQQAEETRVAGLVDEYSGRGHDAGHSVEWLGMLTTVFTPTRYLGHGMQMGQAYLTSFAPSSYVTNTAAFAMSDLLRRVTVVSYRTRELQMAHPDAGFATGERAIWENHPAWQPARELIERVLTAYDWGEAFVASNLVIGPTLDDLLIHQFGEVAKGHGDDLTWLLHAGLGRDSDRRARWSAALAAMTLEQRPDNAAAIRRWVDKWTPRADAAVEELAQLFPDPASAVAQATRRRAEVLDAAGMGVSVDA